MKLTLKHQHVRSTNTLDSWVEEQIISLQPNLKIDEAEVRLTMDRDASPAYKVEVHLVTPGPDVFGQGCDHTLQAAFKKVMDMLRDKIGSRATRRQRRRSSFVPTLRPA
jgi:ribosome-associated translation inhibitor RaiA